MTVALAAQTHEAALLAHGLGSARLVDRELHGPVLNLRPTFRTRLKKAAQLTVPARSWVGRNVRACQVGSALARHLPVKEVDADDVAADMVVAWTEGSPKEVSAVVIALFVATDTEALARISTFVKRVEAEGPVTVRVVVLDQSGANGADGPGILTSSDLV